MTEQLFRLVYCSRNYIPGDPAAQRAEIDQILAASQRNNPKVGVTGALMFNRGYFAQVLEGPLEAVEQTFERIQCDLRHGEVDMLQLEHIDARSFGAWAMAFVGESTEGQAAFNGIGGQSGFDPEALDGDDLFAMMCTRLLEEESNVPIQAAA